MAITRKAEAQYRNWKAEEVKVEGGLAVRYSDVCVHEFRLGEVDDPEIYAAEPLWKWQESEAGQWIMEHAVEKPFWHRMTSPYSYGWTYYIIARLSEQDQTYWALKWQKS